MPFDDEYNQGADWLHQSTEAAEAWARNTANRPPDWAAAPRRWVARVGNDLTEGGSRALLFGLAVGFVLYLAWR